MQRADIGKRLVEERKRLGLNQTDFGRLGAVSKGSQILYEKGDGVPTGDYLAAIAASGADVQYVLTGVRSSVALTPEERLLVERFRSSTQGLRDAALRVLLGEQTAPSAAPKQVFKGDVAQHIEGNATFTTPVTFNMGSEKRKK